MITSADFISGVIMDCTGFAENCKRFVFNTCYYIANVRCFSQAKYDLLH
jgi:hypothetical protein